MPKTRLGNPRPPKPEPVAAPVTEPDDLPTPEEVARPILFEREALIARLKNDERIQALREALDEAEQEWLTQVARVMISTTKPVDQRKIDYTRGYFAGAQHWLSGRMSVAEARLATSLEPKEDDA